MLAKNRQATLIIVLGLAILMLIGLIWVNYQFAKNNPGGNDFLAHYIGTRALYFEGISPYSDQVALKIQEYVFGRAAQAGEIEHRVVYPIYSTLIFLPFSIFNNYLIARVAWMVFSEVALVVIGLLSLRIFNWQPKRSILGLYLFFSVFWYHGFRSVINGNAVIVVGLLITAALFFISEGKDKIAGITLAFSTIKPNLVLLLILFVIIWSILQNRSEIAIWFFISLAVLAIGGMAILPDWIQQNLQEIIRYPSYNPAGTLGDVFGEWFPGSRTFIKGAVGAGLGGLLLFEWVKAMKKDQDWFLWTASLTLVISQWIGIQTDPGNFVILFPAFVLVLAFIDKRWGERSSWAIVIILLVVLASLWLLFIATIDYDYQPMQSSVLFLPFPGIVLLGLYWMRSWVTKYKINRWSAME